MHYIYADIEVYLILPEATMKRFFTLTLLTLSLVATVGCGKSDAEIAEERVDDYNAIAGQISKMGIPNTSWSDADLNKYESLLNKLEAQKRALDDSDSSGEVKIVGGASYEDIQNARQYVRQIREQKARNNSNSNSGTSNNAGNADKLTHIKQLIASHDAIVLEYQDAVKNGGVNGNTSVDELQKLISILDRLINTRTELISELKSLNSSDSNVLKIIENLEGSQDAAIYLRSDFQSRIAQKSA
jgi:hypothetical protein